MGMSRETFFELKNVKYAKSNKKEEWYDEKINQIIFKLIKIRKAEKLTQTQVADLCGCARSTIARAEILIHRPTVITLIKWCNALGCKITLEEK